MNKTSLLELEKKLNIPHRNCVKTKEGLEKAIKDTITGCKKIIFGADTPACMVCLYELWKQQVIDQKCMIKSWWMIRWGNLLGRGFRKKTGDGLWHDDWKENNWGIGSWSWFYVLERQILRVDFMVFADHKVTCCKVEELQILNGSDTLDTWSINNFS